MAYDPVILEGTSKAQLALTDTCIPGDGIGFDGTNWVRSDADATQPIRVEYFALERCGTSGNTINVARKIVLYDQDAPYTKGAFQFASGTAGKHTETNPVAAGTDVQVVGRALTTDTVMLDAAIPHISVKANVASTAAATAANFGYAYVADKSVRLIAASEVHRTAGSDGGAVTLDIEKCASGTSQDSGVSMLASTFNLKGTAATPQVAAPTATAANARLKPGDSVALKDSGTLTALADVAVNLLLVPDL